MCRATLNGLDGEYLLSDWGAFGDQALDKDWGTLLLSVGVLYTKLALGIGAHRVN